MKRLSRTSKAAAVILLALALSACVVGAVVGTAVDVGIEVAKVPFKVGGAVIDVATDDDDDGGDEEDLDD